MGRDIAGKGGEELGRSQVCWVTVGTVLAGQWSVWSAGTGARKSCRRQGPGIQPGSLASRSASDAAEPCGLGEA